VIIGDFFWIYFSSFSKEFVTKLLFTKMAKVCPKKSLVNESFYATLNLDIVSRRNMNEESTYGTNEKHVLDLGH
jgi:hypothetical protein